MSSDRRWMTRTGSESPVSSRRCKPRTTGIRQANDPSKPPLRLSDGQPRHRKLPQRHKTKRMSRRRRISGALLHYRCCRTRDRHTHHYQLRRRFEHLKSRTPTAINSAIKCTALQREIETHNRLVRAPVAGAADEANLTCLNDELSRGAGPEPRHQLTSLPTPHDTTMKLAAAEVGSSTGLATLKDRTIGEPRYPRSEEDNSIDGCHRVQLLLCVNICTPASDVWAQPKESELTAHGHYVN
ncbi:hypothetical protein SAMN05216466_113208 [Paraburkholderia phenazinium]|uniref:Uncharacterized protein n=1 Tax=Paraburkholderia phenazinium TaxID=60549 RepID=A0A1G8FJ36_9BURK|nr:hypothetical protein SAMN05216466_113208 [Paraburkholderia phenazinium]